MAKIDPQEVVKFTLPLWIRLARWGITAFLTLLTAKGCAAAGLNEAEIAGAATTVGGILAWGGSVLIDKLVNKKAS